MAQDLEFLKIPHVLDDDEIPFVIGFRADPRKSLQVGTARYRRGTDRYVIEQPTEQGWLRATAIIEGEDIYLTASAGPILNEWWPLLRRNLGTSELPILSAAAKGQSVELYLYPDLPLRVRVLPSSEDVAVTMAVIVSKGGPTPENLRFFDLVSLAVIKVALETLGEYRQMVGTVPDILVKSELDDEVPLATVLDVAAEIAKGIPFRRAPR